MATKQVALLVITNAHSETGHGGESSMQCEDFDWIDEEPSED